MTTPLELWGGVECTVNRVGDRWFDQMEWSGHAARLSDLTRFHALGLRTLRYPVLWERLAPSRLDDIDWRWTDERMSRLRELGVAPVAGLLHHGSGPRYTSLLDPDFPQKFAAFAAAVARRYPWISDYTPINEPLTTARFSGLYGHWYPHGCDDRTFVRALINQLRGVVLAMRAIRTVAPGARLIQTEDCGRTFGRRAMRDQVAHEDHRRWLTWDFLTGAVGHDHPLRAFLGTAGMTDADEEFFQAGDHRPDIVGLNYYLTSDRYLDERLSRHPAYTHGGNGVRAYADVEAVRGRPAGIEGHERHLMAAWQRYGLPVAITEAHLGCTREEQLRWLVESWHAADAARHRGADVRAVTAWALLGSFNWNSLVTRDEGHYEPGAFDVRAVEPRPTALATVIRQLTAGDRPAHAALPGLAWWRRPRPGDRVRGHASLSSAPAPDRPILIVGSGTLEREFRRACRKRGLPARITPVQNSAEAIERVVAECNPWAIVNAESYRHVDDAERERDACRRTNVVLPVTLAGICQRKALPLLTFSSDLVFDGRQRHAYTEDDEPNPLSIFGATKREAERRVLTLMPDALVVRSGAFFGPENDDTFLACLVRAIDAGTVFFAPADTTVSPTYVPDLVDASLDLLIDGERGLWHVANSGATTWFDFAQAAARGRRPGTRTELIVADAFGSMPPSAPRPFYSVLASRRAQLLRTVDAALAAWTRDAHRHDQWKVGQAKRAAVA